MHEKYREDRIFGSKSILLASEGFVDGVKAWCIHDHRSLSNSAKDPIRQ